MKSITLPTDEKTMRSLSLGDVVSISGVIYTARDAAHKHMVEKRPGFLREKLKGTMIYHCGPIMKRTGKIWEVVAAGPTTSIREEPYEATVIEEFGVRGIIGKGGMGGKTLEALSDFGSVYLAAVGGAAAVLAEAVKRVRGVYFLEEFGIPEAMWEFEVSDFQATVSMDSHGGSLYDEVARRSEANYGRLFSG
ncbi:MAG: FumA C-terminus/TtdB family hydratase beta subunit [Candidatus Glassbacteria bacterium]